MLHDTYKARIQFHCSNYRMHDGIGRTYMTLDGIEVISFCTLKSNYYTSRSQGLSQVEFFEVLNQYFEMAFNDLVNEDHLVFKLLTGLDKRCGKRTLKSLQGDDQVIDKLIQIRLEGL